MTPNEALMWLVNQLKSFKVIWSHLSQEATKLAMLKTCNAHCPFLQGLIKEIGHSDALDLKSAVKFKIQSAPSDFVPKFEYLRSKDHQL